MNEFGNVSVLEIEQRRLALICLLRNLPVQVGLRRVFGQDSSCGIRQASKLGTMRGCERRLPLTIDRRVDDFDPCGEGGPRQP
jgi:hypothetical protein